MDSEQVEATITSKRQLTIPIKMYKKLGLKKGEKVIVREVNGELRIKSSIQESLKVLDQLAGSVKIPKRFKGMTIDEIIEKAKQEYFEKRRKHYMP